MRATHSLPPLLHGLFRELVARGVPVGVRDYLDGVRALRAGFGHGDRQSLRELALALWARDEEERRLINRWFQSLPPVPPPLTATVEALVVKGETEAEPEHKTPAGSTLTLPKTEDAAPGHTALATDAASAPPEEGAPRVRLAFAGPSDSGGLPIPRMDGEPLLGEDYVLHPHVIINARDLAVLWRRFRRTARTGPRTELDLDATLRERCRRGLIGEPVLRARRRNNVRLLVLADASASMDPWRPFLDTLADSLRLGRFARAEIRYFSNLPRRQFFRTQQLTAPEASDAVLARHAGAALLIVSDAGCARGYLNRRRAVQTLDFLDTAARHFSASVWLNPMPRARWAQTTASLIASSRTPMLPLDADHLLRAIDILRGNKQA
ncbi:hypothetical protein CEW87_18315 [Parazoarcus communis]|uniref:VWA containing CoxE family protein n=1 Tax=Parazoarcus communis TaxID=41977 RepID=A0A2U8H8T8_9RHOO|nr:VWA domain-containing protein [Parazoarcus communis]AWI81145.1 hypothetical protein CEW87_18315 [Parazoarcus communis]